MERLRVFAPPNIDSKLLDSISEDFSYDLIPFISYKQIEKQLGPKPETQDAFKIRLGIDNFRGVNNTQMGKDNYRGK